MTPIYFDSKLAMQVPGSWNELSRHQVRMIIRVLYSRMVAGRALVVITIIIMQLWRRPAAAWTIAMKTTAEARYDLTDIAAFVFGKNTLTRNPLPSVRVRLGIRLITMHGPADSLRKQSFLEFIKCETYYLQWRADGSDQALDKLMAALYRPGSSVSRLYDDGERREPYNDNLVTGRASLFSAISSTKKLAVAHFYEGCRETLICPLFREVFPVQDPADDSDDDQPMPKSRPSGSNWLNSLRHLAGGALEMERMGQVERDVALFDLNMKMKEQREMADEIKNRKRK